MIEPESQPRSAADRVASAGDRAIVAVVPCWNRPADLARVLGDLSAEAAGGTSAAGSLSVLVVDNASDVPLETSPAVVEAGATLRAGGRLRFLRLASNLGGSGGYNAGITAALAGGAAAVWLVDSDARVERGCLAAMLRAVRNERPAAVGARIAHPATGKAYESGARIDPATGALVPIAPGSDTPIDYASACCLLVPAESLRAAGLLPDLFLRTDDVAFGVRLRRATGRPIVVPADAKCRHPAPGRFSTWPRYYDARNWIVYAQDAGLGRRARFVRSLREVALAAGQALVGRDDLARLHLRGLADAAAGRVIGRAAPDRLETRRTWPMHTLEAAIRAIAPAAPTTAQRMATIDADAPINEATRRMVTARLQAHALAVSDRPERNATPTEIFAGLCRAVLTPPAAIAVVSATAPPHAWSAGRIIIAVGPGGYTIARLHVIERVAALIGIAWRGLASSIRLALAPPTPPSSPPASGGQPARENDQPASVLGAASKSPPGPSGDNAGPSLSIVILTRDRRDQLLGCLDRLVRDPAARDAEIVVVDNHSSDSTAEAVRNRFKRVRVIETGGNLGVEGFNRGVAVSSGEVVLILDDDAWPDEGALERAMQRLNERPDRAAVMLHPRHPRTHDWEWPGERPIDDPTGWPILGSGNLVRRADWDLVGGYEAGYFLYRNDTDLALKLLAAGRDVVFSHDCVVWHDSPLAAKKNARWHRLATRNWLWMSRRHGRAGSGVTASLLGWAWAHKLAGLSVAKHGATLRGVAEGLLRRPPKLEAAVRPDGRPLRRLVSLKRSLRG
ncbi:MAG: glycosyltransferase [Planctomycetota bacterium]